MTDAPRGVILPDGVGMDDQIELLFERNPERTQVIASLGGAKITVEISDESEGAGIVLVQALPTIMNEAYAAMDNDQEDEDQ